MQRERARPFAAPESEERPAHAAARTRQADQAANGETGTQRRLAWIWTGAILFARFGELEFPDRERA